jgi:hypothetical protein
MTLDSVSMSQIGSTLDWFGPGYLADLSLWGLTAPANGSGKVLTGSFASAPLASGCAGAVFNGVDQTTPTGDVDSVESTGTAATSFSPSLTLSTPNSNERVVMVVAARITSGPSITTSGENELTPDSTARTIHITVFDKAATTTSTTINPTVSWTGSADFQYGAFAVVLNPTAAATTFMPPVTWFM